MSPSSRCSRCDRIGLVILDDSEDSPLCPDCHEEIFAPCAANQSGASQSHLHRRTGLGGAVRRHGTDVASEACSEDEIPSRRTTIGASPARKRKRKRRREREAKRARRKRLLLGAGVVVLLLGVGLAIWWVRSGGEGAVVPVEPPVAHVAVANAIEPTALAQAVPELLPSPQEVEDVPPPREVAWEQLDAMPALVVEAAKPGARQPGMLKRRRNIAEDELRDQLAQVPEMGLTVGNVQTLADSYDAVAKLGTTDFQPSLLLQVRPDLATLPVRARQLDPAAAATLGKLSKKLHAYVENATPKDALGQRLDPVLLRQILYEEKRGKRMEWLRPEAVPVLRQLLGHEQTPIRSLMIELLGEITGYRASELLAERAVFDLAPDVRLSAVDALRPRPREQFRHVFLAALRNPWAPAADHAAEALTALEDRDAVPHLVTLLDQPDPSAPFPGARGSQMQRQLVRVNHTASCLMCHPPALSTRDPVIGVVPGLTRFQSGGGGWGGAKRAGTVPFWVRADVTFFRQDFSESIAVGPVGMLSQPTLRFDFLVRKRALGPKELKRLQEHYAGKAAYEQRDAVLFALRELTGQNPGPEYQDWLKLYPSADVDTEAARLTAKLLKAAPGQRDQVLTQLRDGKGAASTQGLAQAIPKLPAAERAKARDALAKRLARMTADSLRAKLRDADAEVRRAAAAACVQQNDPSLVADLVSLLDDEQPPVSAEAQASLKVLTGQDRGNLAAAWLEWLKTEGPK